MRYVKWLIVSLFLGFSALLSGQNLPALPKDGSITIGNLPNGISYYIVTNQRYKGVADFALVRRGRADSTVTRSELAKLPHFNTTTPRAFLSRKSIGCGRDGYISYPDGSTLFRFDEVSMTDQAASDSTLLMLFDIVAGQPYQYAVIVSGDVNAQNLVNRMSVFCMSVPHRNPVFKKPEYSWTQGDGMTFGFKPSRHPTVSLDLRSPRTPDAQMNTIQPFLTNVYVTALTHITRMRLLETFHDRNIPLQSIEVEYVNSSMSYGDEHFIVRVGTTGDHLLQASMALASVVAELSRNGVSKAEYKTAREVTINEFLSERDNSDFVDMCVSSYLWGSDLATTETKVKYMASRNLKVEDELPLFNDFAKAFLDNPENVSVQWEAEEERFDEWTYQNAFKLTWENVASLKNLHYPWLVDEGDTLSLGGSRGKTKLKSSLPEPASGGEVWTFSNGMKVIYKKMPNDGRIDYSLMIRGGFSSVKGLRAGEGAFFSDMLWLYDIAGMNGVDFMKIMSANGVDMKARVSLSDMRIFGSAPSGKLSLVLKSLASVANERRLNQASFDAYKNLTVPTLRTDVLDSLMYPDYLYSSAKRPSGLVPDLLAHAHEYFNKEFIKVNDGVLVIVGDLEKEHAQKTLERYLGAFRVSNVLASRPSIPYRFRVGETTYASEGENKSIDIGLAAGLSFTIENNMAFVVACMQIYKALSGTLCNYGFHVDMIPSMRLYPYESVEVVFRCRPVPEQGLPEGVRSGSEQPERAVAAAKKALGQVLSKPISEGELNTCKALISNQYAIKLSRADEYVNAIIMRYSYGKDIITDYANRINKISVEKVNEVYKTLSDGMIIEYVVK